MAKQEFNENLAREITAGVGSARGYHIETRGGHAVRLLAWNAKGDKPIVGLIDLGKNEMTRQWTRQGKRDLRDNVKTIFDLVIINEGDE